MNRFLCEPNASVFNLSTTYRLTESLVHASIYFLPIFSFVGNALTLLVILTNSQLNRSSFSVYVKSMAISDTCVLLLKFLSFENKTSKLFYFPSLCTGLVFLSDASVLLSVWTIVIITIERTLVVLFPLHMKNFVSTCRARFSIITIAILSLLLSARHLFIPIDVSAGQRKRCHPVASWQQYRKLNALITEFAHCFVPLSIVIIGNCTTFYTVKRAMFRRREILINPVSNYKQSVETHKNQLTVMLFLVTIMFIVYFVPFTVTNFILRWGLPFGWCFTKASFENYLIIRSFCELLKDFNFCTNFIIYCVSGRRFRYAVRSLFVRQHHRLFAGIHQQDSSRCRSDRLLQHSTRKTCRISIKHTYEEHQF